MLDLGFTELSMEPVVCAPDDPAALTAEDLEIVKKQYEELALLMLDYRQLLGVSWKKSLWLGVKTGIWSGIIYAAAFVLISAVLVLIAWLK